MSDIQFPHILLGPGSVTAITIHADWTISPLAALLLGGDWQLAAYVESIGAGPEQQVGPTVTIPLTGGTNYSADIVVPANTLPGDPAPPNSGVYKTSPC